MKIDQKTIQDTAHLARLQFTDEEEKALVKEMGNILGWMDKLAEVDTDNVEPLRHMSTEVNVLREDGVNHQLDHESALKNGPNTDSNYFRVPKVIE